MEYIFKALETIVAFDPSKLWQARNLGECVRNRRWKKMLGVKLALWASMKGMHEGLGVDVSMSKSE